jgi:DNA repair protein RadD
MELRPYQSDAILRLRESIRSGHRAPLLCSPTGSGKTALSGAIARSSVDKGGTGLFLAPRRELITQASAMFTRFGVPHGVIMAGEPRSLYPPWQVASFDTLSARAIRSKRMLMPRAGIVICDEAHLSVADTRKQILEHYHDSIIIGLTATPARGDGRGLGEIYDDLLQVVSVRDLMDQKYLVEARYFAPTEPDLAGIKLNKDGDYQEKQLGARMDQQALVGDIVQNWLRIARDRSTVVFCVTCAHSRHVRDEFLKAGIRAEHLDGETPLDERKEILARVASGETQVLCNVFVATFGLDIPRLSCAVLARPTKNITLYLQIIGRVLRTDDGKDDALIIDHSGAVKQHGFADDAQPWSLDESETVAERKKKAQEESKASKEITCGNCFSVFRGSRECPKCGHAMIPKTEKIPTHEAELVEVKKKLEPTLADKVDFIGQLKAYAAERGKNDWWVGVKFQEKFSEQAGGSLLSTGAATTCNTDVRKWIQSRNIRYAKRKAKA